MTDFPRCPNCGGEGWVRCQCYRCTRPSDLYRKPRCEMVKCMTCDGFGDVDSRDLSDRRVA